MEASKLLPCPFCGAIPEKSKEHGDGWYTHPTVDCQIMGHLISPLSFDHWNRRTISDPSAAQAHANVA